MRFINFERTKLPKEILKHNLEEKKKYFADISLDVEKSDAEVQVSVVYCFLYVCVCACELDSRDLGYSGIFLFFLLFPFCAQICFE